MEIIPAIIPQSLEDMEEKLSLIRGVVPFAQIDFTDGKFTPEKSWPYKDGQNEEFKKISVDKCLPFCEDINFEADLMIENPETQIEDFIYAGFSRLIIHLESTNKMDSIINITHEFDVEVGIAINIDTPNEALEEYIEKIDFVQFMGIRNIGFQGEGFDGDVINKISSLRQKHSDIIISVDGGVGFKNAAHLLSAGADRLVSGSALFESDSIIDGVERLKDIELRRASSE